MASGTVANNTIAKNCGIEIKGIKSALKLQL